MIRWRAGTGIIESGKICEVNLEHIDLSSKFLYVLCSVDVWKYWYKFYSLAYCSS
jgi:hypothetical protein